ncbi:MAG: TolC family protein, partial [Deltaproteobacteria bacterium]|nr:TolC family protein [Deltaproteobacteria bacterium]
MKASVVWLPALLGIVIFCQNSAAEEIRATKSGSPTLDLLDQELPEITKGQEITLEQALRLADRRNLTLSIARVNIIKAQAEMKSAWSLLIPSASASMTFTHNDHDDTITPFAGQEIISRRQDDLSARIQVDVPLVNAQAWFGVMLAELGEEVTELSVESVRQALLLSVAQAYFQALSARSLIEVQRNQIKSSKRHLAVATIRHRSGTGRRLDVIRARTELLTAHEQLIAAHSALENARDALAILIGVDFLPMPAQVPEMSAPQESEADMISKATIQREDLKLTRTLVRLADKQIDTSWMLFLSSLYGSWQFAYQFTDPSSFQSGDKSRWFYFITLSVPLYSQTRYADLEQKRAALHKAELEAQDAKLKAILQLRTARRNYETAMLLVGTSKTKAELASQALRLAESAYENGTG